MKTIYPILFDKVNICVQCGAEGSLVFVDKYGNKTKQEIHPYDHIVCTKCGAKFEILWKKDGERMYPVAADPIYRDDFLNHIS